MVQWGSRKARNARKLLVLLAALLASLVMSACNDPSCDPDCGCATDGMATSWAYCMATKK